jgi:hypothetical protein
MVMTQVLEKKIPSRCQMVKGGPGPETKKAAEVSLGGLRSERSSIVD